MLSSLHTAGRPMAHAPCRVCLASRGGRRLKSATSRQPCARNHVKILKALDTSRHHIKSAGHPAAYAVLVPEHFVRLVPAVPDGHGPLADAELAQRADALRVLDVLEDDPGAARARERGQQRQGLRLQGVGVRSSEAVRRSRSFCERAGYIRGHFGYSSAKACGEYENAAEGNQGGAALSSGPATVDPSQKATIRG